MYIFFQKRHALSILETIALAVILAAGLFWFGQEYRQQRTQQDIAGKILRFHVRANSDSRQDQQLKLKVRDAVGSYMHKELSQVDSLSECREVVQGHLEEIIHTAEQAVAQEGYAYPVTARVETVTFPEKTYGNYCFPAGDYQALELTIGSGEGRNWWCVMYPNMCFHGAVYEVVDKDAEQSLQRVLSEDEYDAVLKSGQYRVRFKYLDFLNRFFESL